MTQSFICLTAPPAATRYTESKDSFELETVLLWGNDADLCTAVLLQMYRADTNQTECQNALAAFHLTKRKQ